MTVVGFAVGAAVCVLPPSRAQASDVQSATFAFDVPAGRLNQVVLAIARQSGQVISFDPPLLQGLNGPAVVGRYPVDEALERALEGSDLEVARSTEGVIIRRRERPKEVPRAASPPPARTDSARPVSADTDAVVLPQEEAPQTVVVTASKRAEDIQDVPISVSAFSGDFLERVGVNNATELARSVPSVAIAQSNNNRNTSVFMRGIGTPGSNPGIEASVGIFLDGVYIPAAGPIQANLQDLSTVEFLRGPQGTLYGRNTPVGAINITSRAPSQRNEALLSARIGNYEDLLVSGYVGGGLTEKVAGRVSFWASSREGYETNLSTGDEVNGQEQYGVRGRLLWDVADSVTGDFIAYYSRIRSECCTPETLAPIGATGIATPGFLAAAQAAGHPFRNFTEGDHVVDDDREGLDTAETYGASVTLNVDLPGEHTLTSITAFNGYTDDIGQLAADGLPQATGAGEQYLRVEGLSEELRIASSLDRQLSYIAGIYLFSSDMTHTTDTYLGVNANRVLPPARAFLPTDASSFYFSQDTRSAAVFGQTTFRLTDSWRLTGGARYSWDRKTASLNSQVNPTASPAARAVFSVSDLDGLRHEESELTWSAGTQYDVSPDVMVYALAATGYKTGGFNARSAPANVPVEFDSESSLTYELGVKSSWLGHRLVLNADVYTMKLSDFQDSVLNPLTNSGFIIDNAGDRRVSGVEVEAVFRPIRAFSLQAGAAYMDAEFTSYTAGQCYPGRPADGTKPGTCNYNGLTPAQSPKWSGSFAGQWQSPLGGTGLEWFTNADITYSGGKQLEPTLAPFTYQDAVTLVGARLGLAAPDGRWRVSAYGKNLTDEVYYHLKIGQPLAAFISAGGTSQAQGYVGFYAPPRTWGVEASVKF